MSPYLGTTHLPRKKTNRFIQFVDERNHWCFLWVGISAYVGVVVAFSLLFLLFDTLGLELLDVTRGPTAVTTAPPAAPPAHAEPSFFDLLYFNFANILTLDTGTFSPMGLGKALAIFEAVLGVAVLGGLISIVAIKLISPSKDSIVFSKYGYYAQDEERFFIIFVNTNHAPLVQAEMSLVVKTGFHWSIRSSIMAPYIGESAWTFFVGKKFPEWRMRDLVLRGGNSESIKFGISGSYGFTSFASSIRYTFKDIIVVPSRRPFEQNPIYGKPDYTSREFVEAFHFKPELPLNFFDYAKQHGATEAI